MAPRATPPKVKKEIFLINKFRGVDLSNSPSNVDKTRSPNAPNMIRDEVGKVRKRMGYHKTGEYPDRINGVYFLNGEKIVHSGTKLYKNGQAIYTGVADTRAKAWQIDGKLYLQDGVKMLCYGEFDGNLQVKPVEDIATVPTVVISRKPEGGGTPYEPLNFLQSKWTESFLGEEGVVQYQLTSGDLDATAVTAQRMLADGTWKDLTENTHFTVDRVTGTITFLSGEIPGAALGADNVKITASKTREGYKDKINKCTVSILFGVNGAANRMFVTGNPSFKNYDWYSQINDPTFFGDTWYSILGQDTSGVVGYSIVSDMLAAHKDEGEDGRNVILRRGVSGEDEDTFPITNTILGPGAIGKHNFAYLNEALFTTKMGIYAITVQDVTGERYTQRRSFYIDRALWEEDLEEAYALIYKDFYVLATSSRIYILDGLQKYYEKGVPYSAYQYECYYFEIPNVRVLFEENSTLCFGTEDGEIMEFYKDVQAQESYNDNQEAIHACWDLPDIDGNLFYENKTYRYIAVRLSSAIATGVEIWALQRGLWSKIAGARNRATYFDFGYVDFSKINFSSDTTPRTLGDRIKIKKVDKARFRFQNEELNEPFGIYSIALEYTQNGKFKG